MIAAGDRRRALRLLVGGAVGVGAPMAAGAAVPRPGAAAAGPDAMAVFVEEGSEPTPAALARPVPRSAPAAAVARLADAEADRAAVQGLAALLRQAWIDLDRANEKLGRVARRRADSYLYSGASISESLAADLFDSGAWDAVWSVHADARQARREMQQAARAHGAALLSLVSAPAGDARQAALRAVAEPAQAREAARRRLVAARRRYAALAAVVRERASSADAALARWTDAVAGLAADAVVAQEQWRKTAWWGAELRNSLGQPALARALGPGVPALPGAGPGEPPWQLDNVPAKPPAPGMAEGLRQHMMLEAMLYRAHVHAERAIDAAAWQAMTRAEALASGADCGEDACARFASDEADARDAAAGNAGYLAEIDRDESRLAARLRDAPRAWNEALRPLRALERVVQQDVLPFVDRAVQVLERERQALKALAGPVSRADRRALRRWVRAWRDVHGELPAMMPAGRSPTDAATSPFDMGLPDAGSGGGSSRVAAHALHRLVDFDDEPRGFGVYTYVLVLTRMDSGREVVRQRLKRIEEIVRDLVPASEVRTEDRGTYNTFVMPTGTQQPAADGVAYDVRLAQQLAGRLPAGWHLPDGIRAARMVRPGPFLISLPVPASQASGDSPVLFADLSDTPPLAVRDVVNTYMTSLKLPDPADTAVRNWQPPGELKVAMALVRVSQTTGELFSRFFSTAEAKPR